MRKFLLPIINLVNVILVSITFGLGKNPAAKDVARAKILSQNYYNLVWGHQAEANIIGIVGFFLFVVAVALTVFSFLPVKARKFTVAAAGGMYIAAGVLFLLTPSNYCYNFLSGVELTGSLTAMAVLVFIAGAFSLAMSAIDFTSKKAE